MQSSCNFTPITMVTVHITHVLSLCVFNLCNLYNPFSDILVLNTHIVNLTLSLRDAICKFQPECNIFHISCHSSVVFGSKKQCSWIIDFMFFIQNNFTRINLAQRGRTVNRTSKKVTELNVFICKSNLHLRAHLRLTDLSVDMSSYFKAASQTK